MCTAMPIPHAPRPAEAGLDLALPAAPAPQTAPPEIPTDRLIVKYRSGAVIRGGALAVEQQMQALSFVAGVRLVYGRALSGDAQVLRLPGRLPPSEVALIARRLTALPEVEFAEPDRILLPLLNPNDPNYASQWHYFEPYGINAPLAWDITTGASGIRIAVIDTGITDHSDLAGRWVGGYDFVTHVATANDGNGRDSDPHDPGDWITPASIAASQGSSTPAQGSVSVPQPGWAAPK